MVLSTEEELLERSLWIEDVDDELSIAKVVCFFCGDIFGEF